MEYSSLPGIDKPISRIVHGSVMINSREEEKSFALLDAVYEGGCTCIDTAHNYGGGGDNERTVGKWINSRGVRDKIVILGKGAHHSRDRKRVTPYDITADIFDSLARFETDYIDLYILHRDDPDVPVGPIVETLNELHHLVVSRPCENHHLRASTVLAAVAQVFANGHAIALGPGSFGHIKRADKIASLQTALEFLGTGQRTGKHQDGCQHRDTKLSHGNAPKKKGGLNVH